MRPPPSGNIFCAGATSTCPFVFALAGLLTLIPAGVALGQLADEGPRVAAIDVQGNQFLQRETLLYYVSTKPGDRYDERRLRDDFRRLWETGFLEDMVLDVRDSPQGKLVIFQVRERKRIQVVDYRGSKALTNSSIEDELKKREASLKIDTFYDLGKARRVETIIKEMLVEKGRPFGSVKHDAKNIGSAGTQVSFLIDDGPKAKVKSIDFTGNEVFSDGKLRKRMKAIKPAGFWNLSWLSGKTKYTDEKWSGGPESDKARLEDFYLDHGYVTAAVGEPKITYTDGKSGLFKKKPVKWMHIEVPVTEGDQYRVGEIKFSGLTVFKEEVVRPIFKLETGEVYRESPLKKGFEKLRDVYGSQGYFQFTGVPQRKPDPARKLVDVVLSMDEDKKYYVGKIRFTGNQSTRDKVIRREVYLNEGEPFNTEALKLSIRRINQLGYFKPMEGAPEFGLNPKRDDLLDITFKVEEQNRNQFTFGGGVSALEGTFLNASFSTANFLGLGETLSLAAQTGQRSRNFQIAATEPYFLDRPITAGVELFLRRITYNSAESFVGFSEQDQGFGLTGGTSLGRFARLFVGYNYQIVDLYDVDENQLERLGLSNASYLQAGRRYESRLTPSWIRNTVDSPFTPRIGTRNTASLQFVGGPLGGNVSYYSPTFETIYYHPVIGRSAIGLRAQGTFIAAFGATQEVPYYQRLFMGGENQIRGFALRAVAPIDPVTRVATGGNKSVLFNAEYYLDLFGPLRLLLFFDAGEAYLRGQAIDLRTLSTSTGAELRFLMPVLNVPFRLIYAWNPNRASSQPATAFKFAVGSTF